jgi:HJR/Mrr/RecB family endonuclease
MFGVLRSIWFPVWLAGIGAALTALVLGYVGWKLRSAETDIRERFKEQPAVHLQELRTAIRSIDAKLKPIHARREELLIRLNDLMVRKRALENEAVIASEQQRQRETQEREREAFDKRHAKLQLLNSRWENLRGIPFEMFLADVLRLHGYQVELTQASNDQGVDLVAVIYGQRVAIQAKGYSNTVGNESVQQVVAGKRFYGCTHTAVITNSSFTNSALVLAESNECLMIDYTVLPTMILHGWPERGVRR